MTQNLHTPPTTRRELQEWMEQNCFNFEHYSINGNEINEGFGIVKIDSEYIWFYAERGIKETLSTFPTETSVVQHAYCQLKSDKWARAHCILKTTEKQDLLSLKNQLKEMHIEFFQDQIANFESEKILFRLFVFGCDIRKYQELAATLDTKAS